ncbi:unnamed protein product [Bursaphelenchus xylophilus]|uniref:(pine wood nematode) hypothetical protein n=1 Tax=Bursaphelenchus xylophilus TaxID=6326 RepID=A0A7I8XGV1_BURXY|nr:unnamed protein product [Bursaphelenchus xylophilus]CAG9082094.1 unnamed protein product [Bursaphelenchus xylophilus]
MTVYLRVFLLLFLVATSVFGEFHLHGKIGCKGKASMTGEKKIRAEVFSLSIVGRLSNPNHCGDFLVSEDRSFNLVCDDGPLASKFYVPRVFIYHSCDGHCHEFEVRDKFVFEMELSAEGRTRPPIFCSQQVY